MLTPTERDAQVSSWYALPFLAYITLVVFAVIRIVTALFLKETLASAAQDADMQMDELRGNARDYQRKLEELFLAADADGNGTLSATEFVEAMSSLANFRRNTHVVVSFVQFGSFS